MLVEIKSSVIRVGAIKFGPGLNVVLGDENATNSIGKSSLLMIIDFAFGGSSLLTYNTDLVIELGHHTYIFTFSFENELYRYQRRTQEPDTVYRCDEGERPVAAMSLDEYTAFLKKAYDINPPDLSFRTLSGLYLRVWGKDNLITDRPLNAAPGQSGRDCVDNLLKTYRLYEPIRSSTKELYEVESQYKAMVAAVKHKIVPQVRKGTYAKNAHKIVELESELADIKANLAKYATNIAEVVNKEVLALKLQKDKLLSLRLTTSARLQRTQDNLSGNRHIRSRHFADVVQFFPEINRDRLARIEEFHDGIARILREELRESERGLKDELVRIDSSIASIDEQMSAALSAVSEPTVLVDRVYRAAVDLKQARDENARFDEEVTLSEQVRIRKKALATEKVKVLDHVEGLVNGGLRNIVDIVFGQDRKSPHLDLHEGGYSYVIPEDTGTGTAYAGLILFDLTVFLATQLPVVAHDSVLFKNIENDSVARLIPVYMMTDKQSFVSLDEIDKYGIEAANLLRQKKVVQLDNDNVLFIKDWRR